MKLYNKIFGVLCVSLLMNVYAKASIEQPMETISLKAHQLDWKTMSFSMPKATQEFLAKFGNNIKEIREIMSESIISGIANKNPEKFSDFEASFGDTKSLLENSQTIAAILKNEPKAYYIKEKNENGQYDFNIDEANAAQYDQIFNGYIDKIAQTEFGRKVLTTFLLCKFCLGDPKTGNDFTFPILIEENKCAFTGDICLRFDLLYAGGKINQHQGRFFSESGITLHNYSIEESLCHEFIHIIHAMLGIELDENSIRDAPWTHQPFFKELFYNGFENIKTWACQSVDKNFTESEFLELVTKVINYIAENKDVASHSRKSLLDQILNLNSGGSYESTREAFGEFIADFVITLQFENEEEVNTILGLHVEDNVLYFCPLHHRSLLDGLEGANRFDHTDILTDFSYHNINTPEGNLAFWENFKDLLKGDLSQSHKPLKNIEKLFASPYLFSMNNPSEEALEFLLRLNNLSENS